MRLRPCTDNLDYLYFLGYTDLPLSFPFSTIPAYQLGFPGYPPYLTAFRIIRYDTENEVHFTLLSPPKTGPISALVCVATKLISQL